MTAAGAHASYTGEPGRESEAWEDQLPGVTTTSGASQAGNGSVLPSAGRDGEKLERRMSSSGRRHTVDDDDDAPDERPDGSAGGDGEGTEDVDSHERRMRNALKLYIARDRQRKRKEYEAEVEEERLRKEKEARQRQDVMTLEETKEQIEQLEQKLKQLEKEKQQLFMQLKKVLNEDEIRKRQQAKENSEMAPMKMQMGSVQIPMFLPATSQGQGEPPPNQGRPPPLTSHILNKGNMQSVGGGGVKRARSPSPGPYPPHNMYQHRIHHQPPLKHQAVYDHAPPQHKMEDGRMGRQMARAVLWNKPTQYNTGAGVSNAGAYYHLPTSGGVVGVVGERPPPLLYAHHAHTPHTPHTPHHTNLMYAPSPQPQLYLDIVKQGPQHQDKKDVQPQVLIGLSEPHHASGAVGVNVTSYGAAPNQQPPVSRHHVTVHGNMPMHNNVQGPKPGSITQGYPVRQPNPNVQGNMYPNRRHY